MKLLKLNNEFYLLGDDELEIKGGDSYYVNGNVTESAGGEVEKGDYKDCEKVLAASVELRNLPLIDKSEVEKIFREKIIQEARDIFEKMSNIPDNKDADTVNCMRGQFVSGFVSGHYKENSERKFTLEDMARFGSWYRTWYGHPKVPTESYFAAKHFAESMEKIEFWNCVTVEGTNFPYHSKKWNKTLGRTIPSVNEKGYITIKSIYKK